MRDKQVRIEPIEIREWLHQETRRKPVKRTMCFSFARASSCNCVWKMVGVWSLPWRWHILSIPLTTGRGTSAETCGLDDVFPPDDLGSRPETLVLIYIYIYMCTHSLYEFCYRLYIQRECHSVLAKLHPIMFYRGMRGSWSEYHVVFFGLPIVSCSLITT